MTKIEASLAALASAYRRYSADELRWDYLCNVEEETRALIRAELARRGVTMEAFERLGRGQRHS
jgi:hypothetical protein